jgi:NAD(P)-dependent dehydrogenase (short-subunit alcohol dehydrogenase family)
MKIMLIGATGAIGKKVKESLATRHELITVGRNSGDLQANLADAASIERLFEQTSKLDAVIVTAGSSHMQSFQTLKGEQLLPDIHTKLLGQINVVLIGQHYLKDGGSFTLTSGILADEPARDTVAAAVVSGALHSFVIGAAAELKRDLRINVVSPGLAADSAPAIAHLFPGFNPVPMPRLVNAYLKSVEGAISGQILRVYE